MKKIYLDSNATTKMYPECVEAMLPFLGEMYGNASSSHVFGAEAKKHLEVSRRRVAELISASSSEEIIFTSGGTESDNHAIKGVAYALRDKGNHIITSKVDHKAVLNTCKFLEKQGFRVTYLGADKYGMIDVDELKRSITDETILISIIAANNETGTITPLSKIGEIAREKDVLFHTDAVQMIGKESFNVDAIGAHLVSATAHKMHGPKGAGVLYIKKGIEIENFQHGGSQERDKRAGTENIANIAGFATACKIAGKNLLDKRRNIQKLSDLLYDGICSEIEGVSLNGHPEKRLCNTLNVSFEGVSGESIVINMDMEGVAISAGSACASGSNKASHVLESMGLSPRALEGAVRFSLSVFNTTEEIKTAIEKLTLVVKRLRETAKKS